jgi:hypothetical protein
MASWFAEHLFQLFHLDSGEITTEPKYTRLTLIASKASGLTVITPEEQQLAALRF